jgi:predicted RNA-binding protein with PIN domain
VLPAEAKPESDLVVLVDARNVLRSQWPNMPEAEVVERCGTWARLQGCRTIVVFDGRAPGGLRGEEVVDEHVTVVGTGGESADDWIARTAEELAASGRRFRVVTSDRGLRARIHGAERIVGGGAFVRELAAL